MKNKFIILFLIFNLFKLTIQLWVTPTFIRETLKFERQIGLFSRNFFSAEQYIFEEDKEKIANFSR